MNCDDSMNKKFSSFGSFQITACDTFRSGAVEQLRVHARNLDVPLFERGYEKDPAIVAMNGIYEGKQKNMDVVLIDTAGRMQDNKPLMQALAKVTFWCCMAWISVAHLASLHCKHNRQTNILPFFPAGLREQPRSHPVCWRGTSRKRGC